MEEASKHMKNNKSRNIPHVGIFIMSSNIAMNLKNLKLLGKIFLFSGTKEAFVLVVFYTSTPFYVLVMTYAEVQLFTHKLEQFFRNLSLSL
jgi:hypothetical protein